MRHLQRTDLDDLFAALEWQGLVFDDTDRRYRQRESKLEGVSAAHFYDKHVPMTDAARGTAESDEPAWLTDNGRAAKRMFAAIDYTNMPNSTRQKRMDAAIMRVRRNLPHCVVTLQLINKNGNNRKESIWQLSRLLAGNKNKVVKNTTTTSPRSARSSASHTKRAAKTTKSHS